MYLLSKNGIMRRQEINYGELVVLGTDGELPGGNKGRRRSRYTVRKLYFYKKSKKVVFFLVLKNILFKKIVK